MLLKKELNTDKLHLRCRIVMPPMATGKTPDGIPGSDLIEYYRARARGTALIIQEHAYILPEGKAHDNQLSMASDEVIEPFKKLTEAVHGEGACIFAQINHAGARSRAAGFAAKGPSAVPVREGENPKAMTKEDIKKVVKGFVAAALRVKAAGYDGVEIHSAHGYLLNQFYSPITNKREDEYGTSCMEDRIRLHLQVIGAVRQAVGPDYPVALRFGACDYREGGSRVEDVPAAARAFEEAGIDLLDVTGGLYGFTRPDHEEPGYFRELSIAAKSAVKIPVLLTGGVKTAGDAEALLAAGAADLIGVGRSLMADADWSLKALAGEE